MMTDTDTGVPERVDTVNLADLEKKYPSRDGEAFLAALGGSARSGYFNQAVFAELIGAVGPNEHFDGAMLAKALAAAIAAFKPKDEIEGMLASQAVAMHFASMRCLKLALNKPVDMASRYHRDGANLARAMTEMLTALDEKRGKRRRQVVRVEKVTVEAGARAIVGSVNGAPAGEAESGPEAADGTGWPGGA